MKTYLIILGFLLIVFHANAQSAEPLSPILFIYDASGSMWGELDGKTKKEIAADVLSTTVNNLAVDQPIGLIAYGHREKGDCKDVEFIIDIANNEKTKVTTAIKGINPSGKTPLAYSASLAFSALKASQTKATIILITDGIESCDGNICDVVKEARADGIDFKMHIVGFGLKAGETEQLECAAHAGNGQYYDATDASGLGDVVIAATSETVDVGPGNFSVYTIKNGEPVDGYVKAFKAGTKEEVDVKRTYRDTAWLSLPQGSYDFVVTALENTRIEPITISNVKSYDDRLEHKTISFDGGRINLITLNNDEGWDCTSKVINQEGKVVGGSRTYGRPKIIEVNPGTYSVEIEGLVMKGLETKHTFTDVIVESNQTTDITHNFKTGKAMIGVTSGTILVDATINIKDKFSGTAVAGSRSYTDASSNPREFLLNPGVYEVVVKAVKQEMAGKSDTFTIEVKQGETTTHISNF